VFLRSFHAHNSVDSPRSISTDSRLLPKKAFVCLVVRRTKLTKYWSRNVSQV